jgi:hypothetical protein
MWYCAHVIMHLKPYKYTKGDQLVWENMILVEAQSPEMALEKAKTIGLEDQDSSHGTTIDDRPARMIFVGVRKLIECRTIGDIENKPADGTEVTFSEFLVKNEEDVRKLAAGDPVRVLYRNGVGRANGEPGESSRGG